MKKVELSSSMKNDWEKRIQIAILNELSLLTDWDSNSLVFHGGTSLHLSWQSPRFSEDLDFMIANQKINFIEETMKSVFNKVQNNFLAIDPFFKINIKVKSRREGGLQSYLISVQHDYYIGSAKVKIEFWGVDNDFLTKYKSELKQLRSGQDINVSIAGFLPVASLEAAYCDKLVALSTRPFLKWRDLFDIWWLRTQNNINPLKNNQQFINSFKHNLSAYSVPDDLTLETSLDRYLNWNVDNIVKKSEEDLKKWLAPELWKKIYPQIVEQMVILVMEDVKELKQQLFNKTNLNYKGPSL